ncbi:MAG: hypothetical protein ACREX9_18365 [Gammaproteobacteria bacterium]
MISTCAPTAFQQRDAVAKLRLGCRQHVPTEVFSGIRRRCAAIERVMDKV